MNAANRVEIEVRACVNEINQKVLSHSHQAMNHLRNATLDVLGQNGTGRRYGRHIASAPGQPPAPKGGSLRRDWSENILRGRSGKGNGIKIILRRKSKYQYSEYLEQGTRKMLRRPFKERIQTKARNQISPMLANL